jgi:hypothetical protein
MKKLPEVYNHPICLSGIFYGHLVYFKDISYILWLFGIFFPRFGMLYQYKSGNPDSVHLMMSRLSWRKSVVCSDVTLVVVCVLP